MPVEDIAVLIYGSPQPAFPAMNTNHDFVEGPDVILSRCFAVQTTRVFDTVFPAPSTDGLIGNDNAPFEQHFFDITQVKIETELEPNRA